MARIVKFQEFNEELFHGYSAKGEGGGIGSKTADKLFRKVGKFFGNTADILSDYLSKKVDSGDITESEMNQLFDMLEYRCRDKKSAEIHSMVDSEIAEMKK